MEDPRRAPSLQKPMKTYGFLVISGERPIATKRFKIDPGSALGRPRGGPSRPKTLPRRPQDRPRTSRDDPKGATRQPEDVPRPPQDTPRAHQGAPSQPKTSQGDPKATKKHDFGRVRVTFCILFGFFFWLFSNILRNRFCIFLFLFAAQTPAEQTRAEQKQ